MADIFCKIIAKEVPADVLFEDDELLVIKDINPKAPVHYLVVPKKHIDAISAMEPADAQLVGMLVLAAKRAAKQLSLAGYKLVFNVGQEGGQEVPHIHLHLLGGWE